MDCILDKVVDKTIDAMGGKDAVNGKVGEAYTARELKLLNLLGRKGKVLRNVYIPKDNNETSEVDVLFITQKGIFVIESKNYSGWIFGDEKSKNWCEILKGKKYFFYNPIKQNKSHIKNLEKQLQVGDDKYVSLITFNANANLKKVSTESSGIYVVGYKQLKKFMKKQTDKPDILIDEEIENIYQQLLPGTKLSDEEKQEHVNRIKQQYKK